jgi:uncharacterized repeat protein (TIGR01451 family)
MSMNRSCQSTSATVVHRKRARRGAFMTAAKHIAVTILLLIGCSAVAMGAPPALIYNSIPNPLPGNVPSEGYQADHAAEFGFHIQFAGTNRNLTTVTVIMSDWAKASDWPSYPGASGPSWQHPLTLNLYNVNTGGGNPPQPGTLIATRTVTATIPWRPESDPTCTDPTKFRASDGLCYSGLAFPVTFDFTGTTVPNDIIYGLAFNTETFGASPIGSPGPYISLNSGLVDTTVPPLQPTVGSNPDPSGTAYFNSPDGNHYCDGGSGGVGTFRRDEVLCWAPYIGAVSFAVTGGDLAITKTPSAGPYGTGQSITYSIGVTNAGPGSTSNVSVTDTIPAGTTFVSATASQGSCSGTSTVTCSLGTLANGGSASISLVLTLPSTPGPVSNTANVSTTDADPNLANNSATSTVTVLPASQIPMLSPLALILLMLALIVIVAMRLRT